MEHRASIGNSIVDTNGLPSMKHLFGKDKFRSRTKRIVPPALEEGEEGNAKKYLFVKLENIFFIFSFILFIVTKSTTVLFYFWFHFVHFYYVSTTVPVPLYHSQNVEHCHCCCHSTRTTTTMSCFSFSSLISTLVPPPFFSILLYQCHDTKKNCWVLYTYVKQK